MGKVKKSALRAAHEAKTKRHAQRTPLPPKGSIGNGVGNPTAEVLREMVAEDKAKKEAKTAKAASRSLLGDSTDEVAQQVKELLDSGMKQKEVAERLGLGEGKTGTSRVRRLYKIANGGAPAPRRRAANGEAKVREPRIRKTTPSDIPMVTIKRLVLRGRDLRSKAERGGKPKMGDVNVGPVGEQQIRSLKPLFESDGYTVTVEEVA